MRETGSGGGRQGREFTLMGLAQSVSIGKRLRLLLNNKVDNVLCTITLRNFVVPTLSMVGDPLSGNGFGSPNHI